MKKIFKWDRERIDNLLRNAFENISRQKVNTIVHSLNSTNF